MSQHNLSYALQSGSIYSVRLVTPIVGAVETTVKVVLDGRIVRLDFGVQKGEDERVARVDVAGGELAIPEEGEDSVENVTVVGTFARRSAYHMTRTPRAELRRRATHDTLLIKSALDLVDALAGEAYVIDAIGKVEVFFKGEGLAGAWVSSLAANGDLVACSIVHEVVKRLRGVPPVKPQPFDATKLTKVAPIACTPAFAPSELFAGEAPFSSYTVALEDRPPLGLDFVAPGAIEHKQVAACPLADVRYALAYKNLDDALCAKVVEKKTNVVLVVGSTPGVMAKSLAATVAAGARVLGVVVPQHPRLKDTVVLDANMNYGSNFLPAVYDYLGRTADKVEIIATFFMAGATPVDVNGCVKLVSGNKQRMADAIALINVVPKGALMLVLVQLCDTDVDLPSWVNSAYRPLNCSLQAPNWFVGRVLGGLVKAGGPFEPLTGGSEARAGHEAWVMAALRRDPPYCAKYSIAEAQYPERGEGVLAGTAVYGRHMENRYPNTVCQHFLTAAEVFVIADRIDNLFEYCKEWEQAHGFVTGPKAIVNVPIAYHASLHANKFLREILGSPLPTQSAKRVTPLSALFALLDDELFFQMSGALDMMRAAGSPLHTYEACLRVAALGTMTRTDALRKIGRFAAEARAVVVSNRTPKMMPRAAELKVFADELGVWGDTFVTKATWALIKQAVKIGDAASQPTRRGKSDGGVGRQASIAETETSLTSATELMAPARAMTLPPQGGAGRGQRAQSGRGGRGRGRGAEALRFSTS